MLQRGILFGIGAGWIAIGAIFLLDLLMCGHLYPLGAFWGLVGRVAPIRVRFDAPSCTRCVPICPEGSLEFGLRKVS